MKKKTFLILAIGLLCSSPIFADDEVQEFLIDEEAELALSEEMELAPPGVLDILDEEKLIAAAGDNSAKATDSSDTAEGPTDEDLIDPRVLRDFIESKGLINCRQKEGTLTIAGDVRARWTSTAETWHHIRQRGFGTTVPIDRFRSEVNLFFDYVAPRAWVSTKLRWSAVDGIEGTATKVDLERAFIGFDCYDIKDQNFYIEIGRTKIDNLFESKVQFSSFFDGIHLFYTNCWPSIGTFTIHGGPFIVDSKTNHYAWIIETFITKWRGTGFSFKYSFIDWHRSAPTFNYGNVANPDKPGSKLIRDNPRYHFMISQMLLGYERKIDFLGCKTLFLYGAVLANHDPKRSPQTRGRKENRAWYVGFTLGKLCKACDWSFDLNYQVVGAQAVPEFDLAGFGHGNADGGLLSDAILLNTDPSEVHLFTNYKGWQASLLYALTDCLSLRSKVEWSRPVDKAVGGDFFYKAFEMSVIYAF